MLADVFARPVVTLASQEGSAYGAALIAMAGTGEYASIPQACDAVIREQSRTDPGLNVPAYAQGHLVYQSLYPALKGIFQRM